MWHEWWIWAAAGLVLAIVEVVLPGYIFLGFAAGAWGVALLVALGVAFGATKLMVIFAVISLVAFLALRRIFPHSSGNVKVWKKDINDHN